jgi:hypothetical protein
MDRCNKRAHSLRRASHAGSEHGESNFNADREFAAKFKGQYIFKF